MRELKESSIVLSWECTTLSKECIDISAAYSKSKDDEIFSKTILTKYDSDYINLEIQRAVEELFYLISKHSVTIDGSLQSSTSKESVSFETLKPTDSSGNLMCRDGVIELIDHLCQQIIIKKSMLKWCYNCGIKDLATVLTTELNEHTETLQGYLHHLKRPSFSSARKVQ